VKTKIVKNKVAPPFAEAEFDIMYNQGINWEGSVIDAGLRFGVLGKKGAWIQHEGELIGQGVVAAQKTLVDKPELCELIVKQVMDKKNGVEPEETEPEPEEAPVEETAATAE
jgi:recombination protein RecA